MSRPYSRVLIPEPEGGFSAYILELPGCATQGETLEEAYERLDSLLGAYLRAAKEDGADLPEGGGSSSAYPSMAPFGKYLRMAIKKIAARREQIGLPNTPAYLEDLGKASGELAVRYMHGEFKVEELEERLWFRVGPGSRGPIL